MKKAPRDPIAKPLRPTPPSPNNAERVERRQAKTELVRRVWLHMILANPFEPVTPKSLCKKLAKEYGYVINAKTAWWHMQLIRAEEASTESALETL